MVDHFDRRPYLEARLEEKGDIERLAAVRRPSELADIYTCRQGEPLGLGHAVGLRRVARRRRRRSRCCSATSSSTRASRCCRRCSTCRPAPAASCWPSSRSSRRRPTGTASPSVAPSDLAASDVVEVTGLVEKPAPEEAPSNLAVVGRYVLPAGDLRRDPAHQAGQRRRDPAHRRDGAAARRGHAGARHRLPRSPLRHRHAAGLPAGRRAARLRAATTSARRSGSGWPTSSATSCDGDRMTCHGRRRGGRQRADASRRLPGQRAAQAAARCRRSTSTSPRRTATCWPRTCSRRTRSRPSTRPRSTGTRPGWERPRSARSRPEPAGPAQRGRRPRRVELAAGPADPGHLLLGRGRRAAAGRRRRRRAGRTGPTRAWPRSRSTTPPKRGYGVRRAGDELPAGHGAGAAPARTSPRPWWRCFAATGIGHVVVRPSPRVVVVATGDELVDVGRASQPGQVVDANSHALTAAAVEAGALAYRIGICDDDPEGAARAARGPDAAGRPDHHHRRHRHRAGRHGAPDPVPARRRPGRRRRSPTCRSTRARRSASARSAARRCRSSACPASPAPR